MNLLKLHHYLGKLLEAGTDGTLPVLVPGNDPDSQPQELTSAMLINGIYRADPAPKMSAFRQAEGAGLLLSGISFDVWSLEQSHNPHWPPVEPPQP